MCGLYINPHIHLFVPMVIDTFGCWSDRAKPMLGALAHAYAKRTGTGRLGVLHVYATLNHCIMNSVASILLAGMPPNLDRKFRSLPAEIRRTKSASSSEVGSSTDDDDSTPSSSSASDDDAPTITHGGGVIATAAVPSSFPGSSASKTPAPPPAYGSFCTTSSSVPLFPNTPTTTASLPVADPGAMDTQLTQPSPPVFADPTSALPDGIY